MIIFEWHWMPGSASCWSNVILIRKGPFHLRFPESGEALVVWFEWTTNWVERLCAQKHNPKVFSQLFQAENMLCSIYVPVLTSWRSVCRLWKHADEEHGLAGGDDASQLCVHLAWLFTALGSWMAFQYCFWHDVYLVSIYVLLLGAIRFTYGACVKT